MTPQAILEIFDQLSDAPNAVEKVRELVLRLAMSARLVDQNPAEPSGVEVFKAIQQVRAKRLRPKEPVRFSPKDLIKAGDDIHLPHSWYRCVVGEVCDLKTGATPPTQEPRYFGGQIRWLVSGDINQGEIFECDGRISELGRANSNCKLIPTNSVLIALNGQGKTRATVALLRVEATLNQSLVAIIPYSPEQLLPEFLFWNLRSRYRAIRDITGQEQRRGLNMKLVNNLSLPLPPVEEQRRIVARIQELMKLCDQLEVQQKERDARRAALTRAAIARINESPTPENLNFLFHESYSISATDLRKTIANLALRGKLVSRDDGFESVDVLLAHLLDERHAYSTKYGFRTNDLRRNKVDAPYPIPTHWRWVNLSELFCAVTDGDHLPPPKSPDGIAFLTIGNITTGQLDFSEVRYVPKHYYDALAEYRQPRNGDLLYTVVGATYGRPAPVDTTRPFCVQRHIAILKPCQSTNREFLSLLLKSPQVYEQAKASTTGTAQPTIPLGALRNFQVPLPPLSEQDRIARKVSELIALVDRMDEQLKRTKAMSEELLDAFIHLVLHPDKEVANTHKHDSASDRAAIGCYAIRSLTQNASFGRTMLMKVFYLSEAHSGISQGWQPMRQAAGPYDPAIEDFESLGVQSGWFTVKTKTLGNGHEMVQYQSKSGMEAKIAEAVSVLGGRQTEFDRLLNLFQNKTTEEAEIIATLFAAWNDLLIDGKFPSDDEIIREVRENWHYKKERFTPTLLTRWLNWLRQQSVIPRGLAPRTRQQLKLGLS
ncbi:MAG TPA: restriction endonuclease subunit S [Edaphobacter sp.]|nr:restriction endonuclease subunit S [Edaphobacter sp.]